MIESRETALPVTVSGTFKCLPTGLAIPDSTLNVLTGPNNSGKSAILQYLNIRSPLSQNCDYVSPRRFDLSNEVAIALNSDLEIRNLWNQRKAWNETIAELSAPDAIREMVSLPNAARQRITEWHNRYFGELKVERSNPDNEFAAPRITIDGRLATTQGSGSRAVLGVLCALLHPDRSVILVDEPEIGIEPQVQKRLGQLIQKVVKGEEGLPKKQVYIATHSHLFLDRNNVTNNYVVAKGSDGLTTIRQVSSAEELQTLTYHLLGNSPDDLFFPDNILVVEGPSDQLFWRRLLELSGSGGVAVHYSDGEGSIGAALPAIDQMLKTQAYIPWYRERLCVVVDSNVDETRLKEWRAFLRDDGTRVRRLSKNGIEYFYPRTILSALTGVSQGELEKGLDRFSESLRKGGRSAGIGRFWGSKRDLAVQITAAMSSKDLSELSMEILDMLDSVKAGRFSLIFGKTS